jgi:hypothetical protein
MVKSDSSDKDVSKTPQGKASSSIDKSSRQKARSAKSTHDASACPQAKIEQLDKTSSHVFFTQPDDERLTWAAAVQLLQTDENFRSLLTVRAMFSSSW